MLNWRSSYSSCMASKNTGIDRTLDYINILYFLVINLHMKPKLISLFFFVNKILQLRFRLISFLHFFFLFRSYLVIVSFVGVIELYVGYLFFNFFFFVCVCVCVSSL